MPELNHLLPMNVDTEDNEESDEVGDNDVSIEEGAFNVADCEHAEDVAAFGGDGAEVVDDIDWDEDGACEKGNAAKQPSHETKKTKVSDSVKADFVQEFGFLGTYQRWEPTAHRVRYPRRGFVADMVLDFWLVNNLS